jgi:hypothetical protein
MRPRPRRVRPALLLAVAALITAGCITERTVRPAPGGVGGAGALGSDKPLTPARAGKQVPLPTGPVARPALEADTFVSRVTVTLLDAGRTPSDGMVLPLVSPDGAFVAVQAGDAPPWPTLLGAPGAEPALGVQIRAYALPVTTPTGAGPAALEPIDWPTELEPGLVLGRSCDERGFLVEWPREDGSRWIGLVNWATGAATWLAGPGDPAPLVNAHAALGPEGELAYTRRPVEGDPPELVVRLPESQGSQELVLPSRGKGFAYPLFPSRGDIFFALLLDAASAGGGGPPRAELSLATIRIDRHAGGTGRLLLRGTRRLAGAAAADLIAAYQTVAATQSPLPPAPPSPSPPVPQSSSPPIGVSIFHPTEGRSIWVDAPSGSFTRLSVGSMAATPAETGSDEPSFLVTDRDGLRIVVVRIPASDAATKPAAAEVLAGPFVARAVSNSQWPYILVGPTKVGAEFGMRFLRLRLGALANNP